MNLKYLLAGVFALVSGNAFAACELRASMVDIRDNGVTFKSPTGTEHVVFKSPDGIDPDCRLKINATGLPNPRSSIYRDYPTATAGQNIFSRTFIITEPILLGEGSLSFAKMRFYTVWGGGIAGAEHYDLSLSISTAAPIPKGQTFSASYWLSGDLQTIDQAGNVTSSRFAFYPRQIAPSTEITINWKSGTRPQPYTWINTRTLDINFGGGNNDVQNILDYDQLNSQYTGVRDFAPYSETTGVLAEGSLQPAQFKFTLGGWSSYQ